jgi:hypothetical protein
VALSRSTKGVVGGSFTFDTRIAFGHNSYLQEAVVEAKAFGDLVVTDFFLVVLSA